MGVSATVERLINFVPICVVISNIFMMCLSLLLSFNSSCLSINKVRDKSEILPPFALQTQGAQAEEKNLTVLFNNRICIFL